MRAPFVLLTLLSLGGMACGIAGETDDGGEVLPRVDGGRDGGRTNEDAGVDAGVDAGARDAGVPDAGPRDAGPNHPPVVAADVLINRSSAYAGQVVELALGVTDEDGDRLAFTWSGPGTFFENGNPSAQRWVSDEVSDAGVATLRVQVTDGRSPPVERVVDVLITVPRFTDVYTGMLLIPPLQGGQCTGCHGSMGEYQVANTRAAAWQQLVNAPHHRGAACRGAGFTSLVVPGNPAASLLYRKLLSTQPSACGDGMPAMSQVTPAAPRQYIVLVGSWIRAGALND